MCKNCQAKLEAERMEEAPDYGALAQRKNAKSVFECYLKLFDMMTEMEPKLF